MHPNDIAPGLTGDKLISAIGEARVKRPAIAEGFLYEQTILMIAAEPGVGKSTISTQVAVELSSGLPVFGIYDVPKPVKVLYIQAERGIIELLERLDEISHIIPLVKENLVITSEYQTLNLLNYDHIKTFIYCVKRDCPDVKVIIVDPIYPMVSGGLSKDEPASAFTKGMSLVQKMTGATLWYNHHTSRPVYDGGIKVEKDDPFYGSQWLKAHVSGSYLMKESDDGVSLIRKKDNYNLLPAQIDLEYNPQTELCTVPLGKIPPFEKVKNYIKARQIDQKEFTFKDIQASTQLCTRTLRSILMHTSFAKTLITVSTSKHRYIYKAQAP